MRTTLRRIEEALGTAEVHRRGTYLRTAGRRPGAQYRPSWAFSRLHGALFGAFPPLLWVLLATALAWSIASVILGRSSGPSLCAALLALFALSQFVVVVLGDGFIAFEQHLVGARFAVDLLVVLLANAGVTALYRRLRPSGRRPALAASPSTS